MFSWLEQVSVQVAGGWPVAWAVLLVLVGLSIVSSRRLSVLGVRRRWLIGLRWCTACVLALLVAQPVWQVEHTRMQAGRLAVVFDDSASMAWGVPGQRRLDRAQALLERWSDEADSSQVRFFRVGEKLRGLSSDGDEGLRLSGLGSESQLASALRSVSEGAFAPSAVVLVSDGVDTSGRPLNGDVGVAVHTVGFVDEPPLRDDAIGEVEPDARVYLHTQARVMVLLQSVGLGARSLRVQLVRGGAVVDQRTVQVADGETSRVELRFLPRDLGRESYTVRISTHPEDCVPQNNEAPFVVDVVRERLRVLHVAGAPSWDQRFLRGFLKRDPSLDLVSFFILRSTHDITMSDPSELALIPFPTDELFREHLSSFDVVILQNFNYGPYRMARYLPLIRDYVRQGGALAMIGGRLSFDGGGYSNTPIENLLPVKLAPAGAEARVVLGRFTPKRVTAHAHHPLLDLQPDPAAAARAWASLAELEGANRLLGVSEHGVVLWEHPKARVAGGAMPVLVVGEHGRGRTLALGTDSVWRWTMPTAGVGGDPTVYDRFWDRALRWLSRDPALSPSQLTTDAEQYGRAAPVLVKARVRAADYTPVVDALLTVHPLGDLATTLSEHPLRADVRGHASAQLTAPSSSGAYELRLSGERVSETSEPFLVVEGGLELADPRMRGDDLRQLSEQSGGRYFERTTDAPDLETLLVPARVSAGTERYAPMSNAWAGALAAVLFCVEWWLRRRWGER